MLKDLKNLLRTSWAHDRIEVVGFFVFAALAIMNLFPLNISHSILDALVAVQYLIILDLKTRLRGAIYDK